MKLNDLRSKKIAILGLGIENLHLIKIFMKNKVNDITVCDRREREELEERIGELKKNVKFKLGKNCFKDLERFDILFRSPGVPLLHKGIINARKKGVVVYSAIKLFFDLCPAKIIGVTGTKGKGTTSTLIYKILKADKKNTYLGGNIGKAPFEFFPSLTNKSIVVLELSSFQLEDLGKSPHISIITNISQEHLKAADPNNPNYHKNYSSYISAKKNILKYQKANDHTVLNLKDHRVKRLGNFSRAKIHYFGRDKLKNNNSPSVNCFFSDDKIFIKTKNKEFPICKTSEVKLLGEHNLENITAAAMAAYLAGSSIKSLNSAITSFEGLEHRLEFVRDVDGIKYYDESFATTPHSAITAIRAFKDPIILILGGVDKGGDFIILAKEILKRNVKVVILIGKSAAKLEKIILKAGKKGSKLPKLIKGCKSMEEIIQTAKKEATGQDVVLLAPACASFDMFKNYKDRGDKFKEEVKKL